MNDENAAHVDKCIQIGQDAIGNAIISGSGNVVIIESARQKTYEAEEPAAPTQIGPNPYMGLLAFHEKDADRFFGRETLTEQLWAKLRDLQPGSSDRSSMRFLPILGPSGSGKSSLARAGLIAELARRPLPGMRDTRVAVFTPGAHPLEALAGVLARVATGDPAPVAKTAEFEQVLKRANDDGDFDGLRRIADVLPEIANSPLIVLVDQFEEVYSLCQNKDDRVALTENLLNAASDVGGRVSVVVTLRTDFLGETQRHETLNGLICSDQQHVMVPAMNEDELRAAIMKPAELAGKPLDDATVALLINDTRDREGALPLLQFALARIWDGLTKGVEPAITYQQIGGVGGALAGEAQRIYDNLNEEDRRIARRVFLGLVQLGEGTRDTRRRAEVSSLIAFTDDPAHVESVMQRFSSRDARLITLATDEKAGDTAEVTHEALFSHWDQLNQWLDESREDVRFQRRLAEVAGHWDGQGRPEGSLWRPPDLDLLRQFHERVGSEMTPLEVDFYLASHQAEQRRVDADKQRILEKEEQLEKIQHQQHRLRISFGVAAAFAVVAAALAVVAWNYYRGAESEKENAVIAKNQAEQAQERAERAQTAAEDAKNDSDKALGKSFLYAIGHRNNRGLSQVEKGALWDLASTGNSAAREAFLEAAVDSVDAAMQLDRRRDMAVHAAVGFDDKIRQAAMRLLVNKLKDGNTAESIQLTCVDVGTVLFNECRSDLEREFQRLALTFIKSTLREATGQLKRSDDDTSPWIQSDNWKALLKRYFALANKLPKSEQDSAMSDLATMVFQSPPEQTRKLLDVFAEADARNELTEITSRISREQATQLARPLVEEFNRLIDHWRQAEFPPDHDQFYALSTRIWLLPPYEIKVTGYADNAYINPALSWLALAGKLEKEEGRTVLERVIPDLIKQSVRNSNFRNLHDLGRDLSVNAHLLRRGEVSYVAKEMGSQLLEYAMALQYPNPMDKLPETIRVSLSMMDQKEAKVLLDDINLLIQSGELHLDQQAAPPPDKPYYSSAALRIIAEAVSGLEGADQVVASIATRIDTGIHSQYVPVRELGYLMTAFREISQRAELPRKDAVSEKAAIIIRAHAETANIQELEALSSALEALSQVAVTEETRAAAEALRTRIASSLPTIPKLKTKFFPDGYELPEHERKSNRITAYGSLSRSLTNVVKLGDREQATQVATALAESILLESKGPVQAHDFGNLVSAFAAVAEFMPKQKATEYANHFANRIVVEARAEYSGVTDLLASAFQVLANFLDEATARRTAEAIGNAYSREVSGPYIDFLQLEYSTRYQALLKWSDVPQLLGLLKAPGCQHGFREVVLDELARKLAVPSVEIGGIWSVHDWLQQNALESYKILQQPARIPAKPPGKPLLQYAPPAGA